jgi:hypothetical protein
MIVVEDTRPFQIDLLSAGGDTLWLYRSRSYLLPLLQYYRPSIQEPSLVLGWFQIGPLMLYLALFSLHRCRTLCLILYMSVDT